MENNLKYWENRFKFMIEEKAINSYIYLGSNDEFQIKNRPNEVLNPCNLNYIVNQISLLNGVTKDNIHLYYEFMNDNDLIKYQNILSTAIDNRLKNVFRNLNFKSDMFHTFLCKHTQQKLSNDRYVISSIVFGIKDTLKPVLEYTEEIKRSEQYKEYINNKA